MSGVNGVGARPPSQNWRKYLKSINTVRYLSQISRSTEPYKYSRSVAAMSGVKSAKLKRNRSLVIAEVGVRPADVYWVSVNWFAEACGVGVFSCSLNGCWASAKKYFDVTRPARLPLRRSKLTKAL